MLSYSTCSAALVTEINEPIVTVSLQYVTNCCLSSPTHAPRNSLVYQCFRDWLLNLLLTTSVPSTTLMQSYPLYFSLNSSFGCGITLVCLLVYVVCLYQNAIPWVSAYTFNAYLWCNYRLNLSLGAAYVYILLS